MHEDPDDVEKVCQELGLTLTVRSSCNKEEEDALNGKNDTAETNAPVLEESEGKIAADHLDFCLDKASLKTSPQELLIEDTDSSVGQEILAEEPKSIILGILKQLRLNADLHRVTLPAFILEPRSLLERITDFMAFPHLLLHAPQNEDALQRFLAVVRYYLSAWHIRPKGVKKPYNPVLGEFFRCQWDVPAVRQHGDQMTPCRLTEATRHAHSTTELAGLGQTPSEQVLRDQELRHSAHGAIEPQTYAAFHCKPCLTTSTSASFFVAEQVSHHPPVSAFVYANPTHHIVIQGNFRPGSKFLGNSAVSYMRGNSHIFFTNRPGEEYVLSNPNYYIRGLFIGAMLTELGDAVRIECPQTGYYADIDFKTKGYFSGTYNAITGRIKQAAKAADGSFIWGGIGSKKDVPLYTLSGKWTDVIHLTEVATSLRTEFLNIAQLERLQPHIHKKVPPLTAQSFYESRQLWKNVTQALEKRDYEAATHYKSLIEEDQRLKKVITPLVLAQEDYENLVSLDGLELPKNSNSKDDRCSHSAGSLAAPPSSTSLSSTSLDAFVASPYHVRVDNNSHVPLVTRFFQSQDGLNWRFKYFNALGKRSMINPPNTSEHVVSVRQASSNKTVEGMDVPISQRTASTESPAKPSSPQAAAAQPSHSDHELAAIFHKLFHPNQMDDYMDRVYYLSVK